MEIIQVPLHRILQDDQYRFSSASINPSLKNSIKHYGILQPVQLVKEEHNYLVVGGFKRVDIVKELHLEHVPAYVSSNCDQLSLFIIGLSEHLSTHSLNIIEKARIVNILNNHTVSSSLIHQIFKLIDLNQQSKQIQQYLDLLDLHPDLIQYIENYDASLKQAMAFQLFDDTEQQFFVHIARELNIRIVELESIASLFYQISKRDDIAIHDLVEQLEVESILNSEYLTRSQKIQQLKTVLIQTRYPKINQWQNDIHATIKELNLSSNTEVLWDKNLEAPGITLKSNLKNHNDLDELKTFLVDPQNQEIILNLLKILG